MDCAGVLLVQLLGIPVRCAFYLILINLLTVGGVMGYMKSGSQKSLAAGGLSALLLYYVYTQLPTRPAFASFLGLGKRSYNS